MAGIVGSFFTFNSIQSWYSLLVRPEIAPPNWVFGPVWIALYTLMGISLYIILIKKTSRKKLSDAKAVFIIQLALNALWSIIFFGMRNPMLAFFEIILLWIFILLTFVKFYEIEKKAGYILIPYIIWVTFAMVLNYNIWMLNI